MVSHIKFPIKLSQTHNQFSYSAIYLPDVKKYAYLTGMLFYENMSKIVRYENGDQPDEEEKGDISDIKVQASMADKDYNMFAISNIEKNNTNVYTSDAMNDMLDPKNHELTSLYVPKIIVLVSKRALYSEMHQQLQILYGRMFTPSRVPLENMIKNLIFEIPNPKKNQLIMVDYWKIKLNSIVENGKAYYLTFS